MGASVHDQPSLRIKAVEIIKDGEIVTVQPSALQVWLDRGWTAVDDEKEQEADSTDGASEKESI